MAEAMFDCVASTDSTATTLKPYLGPSAFSSSVSRTSVGMSEAWMTATVLTLCAPSHFMVSAYSDTCNVVIR